MREFAVTSLKKTPGHLSLIATSSAAALLTNLSILKRFFYFYILPQFALFQE